MTCPLLPLSLVDLSSPVRDRASAGDLAASAEPVYVRGPSERFTRDGAESLEQHLLWVCGQAGVQVQDLISPSRLAGMLVAGSYGRGEGGVLRGFNDAPHDVMEFVVLLRDTPDDSIAAKLHDIASRLSPFAGLRIEMSALSLVGLRGGRVSVDTYDLMLGHRWVIGDDSLLFGCEQHYDARTIAQEEGTQMMLRVGMDLLRAKERLLRSTYSADDARVAAIAIARAQMGLGDAYLTAMRQYHWSCVQRDQRLSGLSLPAWARPLVELHEQGLEFLLHPPVSVDGKDALIARHRRASETAKSLWLWLEKERLKESFASVQEYARARGSKCPGTNVWQHMWLNARMFGKGALWSKWRSCDPRERVLRSLPLLLWGPTEPDDEVLLGACLEADSKNFPVAMAAFEKLLRQVRGQSLHA